jgi:hypothetical protein
MQRTLAHGRQHAIGGQVFGDAVLQTQTLDACSGQDHGCELIGFELADAGFHISPQRGNLQIRPHVSELSRAPEAAGAD